ncbi:hypothetical protein BSKO_06157 [Bryopsis sp. KO-2023]|nr:hypothetical protein BSKO_06157 [Bryopsis sp. KO-2023]
MALRGFRDLVRLGRGLPLNSLRGLCVSAKEVPSLALAPADTPSQMPLLRGMSFGPTLSGVPGARKIHTSRRRMDKTMISVPSMGDSVTEGSVATLLKHPGDVVVEDEVVAQIETDKVTIDVRYTGTKPGTVKSLLVKEEDTVIVGQAVMEVEEGAADIPIEQPTAGADIEPPVVPTAKPPSPPPTPPPSKSKPSAAAKADSSESSTPRDRPETRVKMTRLRKRVAERLKGAQNTYAMLSTFNEIDMTNIMEMRSQYKDVFLEKHDAKLGFMSAFVKAAVVALKDVPAVNGVIEEDEIVYKDYVDVSFAVATPKGLVVPVLRNADRMSFADVEKTIVGLGLKARDGTISIDEMAGGTFTISNGGVYGSLLSTPIINPPQSAILGMHAIQKRPMVVGKEILARPMMYVALTYDHRLIDGREAVTFLRRIKDLIEDPRRFLLDV